jgi:DedD protein
MGWAVWRSNKTTDPQASDRADDAEDPAVALHVRTRRRLIGAAALLLAAIVVLPLVLDSTPRPIPEFVAIEIPSEKTPFTPKLAPNAVASPATVGSKVAAQPDDSRKEASAAAPAGAAPAPAIGAPMIPAEPAPVASTSPAAPGPAASEPPSPAVAAAAATSAAPVATASAEPSPPSSAPAQFVLQAAAVAQEDSARRLVAKLKAAGFPTYTEKVSTEKGERIRVRVGPYSSRTAAETARQKLAKMGINAKWVDG